MRFLRNAAPIIVILVVFMASQPFSVSGALVFLQSLEEGSSGDDVSLLQSFLRDQGFYTYPEITGYFGSVTKDAVVAYQRAHDIDPIGIVGPVTRSQIALSTDDYVSSPTYSVDSLPNTLTVTRLEFEDRLKALQMEINNIPRWSSRSNPYAPSSDSYENKALYFTATSETASSTFANGINLTNGCFSINGTCITGSGGSLTGTTGQVAYFSGADTAIGTSSIFIDTAGNVGVGTTAPENVLHVVSKSHGGLVIDSTTGWVKQEFRSDSVDADYRASLTLSATNGTLQFRVGQGESGINGSDDAPFRISASSTVGIGHIGQWGLDAPPSDVRLLIDNTYSNTANGVTVLRLQGDRNQVANLTEWTNFGASIYSVVDAVGQFGIGSTTPWKKLSVDGGVAFAGLTGSTGAGSLCLSANNEVVYNSASDSCLPSLRNTKTEIAALEMDALSLINQLEPVSFAYKQGPDNTRLGFIAEDTALVLEPLATYDAEGDVSGIDDRAMLSVVVKAIQSLYAKVTALFESDAAQNERIEVLEARIRELEARNGMSTTNQSHNEQADTTEDTEEDAIDTDTSIDEETPDTLENEDVDIADSIVEDVAFSEQNGDEENISDAQQESVEDVTSETIGGDDGNSVIVGDDEEVASDRAGVSEEVSDDQSAESLEV